MFINLKRICVFLKDLQNIWGFHPLFCLLIQFVEKSQICNIWYIWFIKAKALHILIF